MVQRNNVEALIQFAQTVRDLILAYLVAFPVIGTLLDNGFIADVRIGLFNILFDIFRRTKIKLGTEEHLIQRNGKYICQIAGCGKEFKCMESLVSHYDRHNNSPQYNCRQCGKQYYCRSSLYSHKSRRNHF